VGTDVGMGRGLTSFLFHFPLFNDGLLLVFCGKMLRRTIKIAFQNVRSLNFDVAVLPNSLNADESISDFIIVIVLSVIKSRMVYLSGTGLPSLSWKKAATRLTRRRSESAYIRQVHDNVMMYISTHLHKHLPSNVLAQ